MKLHVEGYGTLDFPELTHKGIPQLQALAYLCPNLTVNAWTGDGFLRIKLSRINFLSCFGHALDVDKAQLAALGGYDANGSNVP